MPSCVKCKKQFQEEDAVFCPYCGKKQSTAPRKYRKRANGTGTITKLSGNRSKPWMARKNDVCVGTFATRPEAQKALEKLSDMSIDAKFNLTFNQIYQQWLPEHERLIGSSAKSNYEWAYSHCGKLYERKFRTLRTPDFQQVINSLEEERYSKSSCQKVMQLFGQLSAWAMREDIISKDYTQYVNTVAKQKSEGVVLKAKTIKAVQNSQNRAADIVLVLLGTGCRPNELFNASLINCHEDYFIGGSKTETGKNRIIAVAPIGRDAYQRILLAARTNNAEKLIDGYEGNRNYSNFVKREFKDLVQEVGEVFTPYDCRHTFATQAKRAGVDPQILRRMLGHASLQTTDKFYTHLDVCDIIDEIQKIMK